MAAIRVLHVISSTMRAGVAVTVMNIYRGLDRSRIQFDFVAHDLGDDDFGPEIEAMGGRVFRIPFLSEAGMSGFVRIIRAILKSNGPYAAVHAHTDYQAGFCALAAWQAGVPIRICHAHSDTRNIHAPLFLVKKRLGRALINRHATQRCACSMNAGISTFGRCAANKRRLIVLPNRIDLSAFGDRMPEARAALEAACHADPGTCIVGCVGRLSPEKNPNFVLDIAAAAKQAGFDMRFAFAGTGDMMDDLTNRCRQMGLEDTVTFLGVRGDIPALMPCFDLVLVPSFTEGFSLAALEAQAAGTPVLATLGVPAEADMCLGLFHALPLGAGAAVWAHKAADITQTPVYIDITKRLDAIRTRGHDISSGMDTIMKLYGLE
jgi:glycosyltransferase EpsF